MKLTTDYSVALYTTEKCILHDKKDIDQWLMTADDDPESVPNSTQLTAIQKTLNFQNTKGDQRIVVLVPDTWLSVSQHRLDHLVPHSLLPLAALSYAVESTFSTPESVLFCFQQEVTESKQTQLTVFACSGEWAEQLCLPFHSRYMSCLLMPVTQWKNLRTGSCSWRKVNRNALSTYQPDYEKRQSRKRLWLCLIMLSVFIHCTAYGYFSLLEQRSEQRLLERQNSLAVQSEWEQGQESSEFTQSVLNWAQTLPMTVRLTSLLTQDRQARLRLTLSKQAFDTLSSSWQKAFPHWRWQISERSQSARFHTTASEQSQEVLDVIVSIVED